MSPLRCWVWIRGVAPKATFVALLSSAMIASFARPQVVLARPTSGDISILSGRTVGNGETVVAAGAGWPALWAAMTLAPSSTLNIEPRLSFLYGSPVMGFGAGMGGEVAVPIRYHLLGRRDFDLAVKLVPAFAVGEGALSGQTGTLANDFGYAVRVEAAAVAGAHVSDDVTLTLGFGGGAGLVAIPGEDLTRHLVGTGLFIAGIEALLSRDTLLFVEVVGGFGFAPDFLFDGHEVFRLSLGLAYLL